MTSDMTGLLGGPGKLEGSGVRWKMMDGLVCSSIWWFDWGVSILGVSSTGVCLHQMYQYCEKLSGGILIKWLMQWKPGWSTSWKCLLSHWLPCRCTCQCQTRAGLEWCSSVYNGKWGACIRHTDDFELALGDGKPWVIEVDRLVVLVPPSITPVLNIPNLFLKWWWWLFLKSKHLLYYGSRIAWGWAFEEGSGIGS